LAGAGEAVTALSRIEHFVVLMLENRSFDHALGYLPGVNGVTLPGFDRPTERCIPDDPFGSSPKPVCVQPGAAFDGPKPDPGHNLPDVNVQMYGRFEPTFPSKGNNDGFIVNFKDRKATDPATIMKCFEPKDLPVLSGLAREYAVCDAWYASIPGPTWPNRLFVHAATSAGHVGNDLQLYVMPTIYDRLDASDLSWTIYYHDIPQSLIFKSLLLKYFLPYFGHYYREFRRFSKDVAAGRLATYTFIEPRFFTVLANDQHPTHDVRRGEQLIAKVYRTLRKSKYWASTLLIIVYDEHGGAFDHEFPPGTCSPDAKADRTHSFDFKRLGLRVPAVVVSPWIPKGSIVSTQFDHTSILATLEKRFGVRPLSCRDQHAKDLSEILSLERPRLTASSAISTIAAPAARKVRGRTHRLAPLSDFQSALVQMAKLTSIPGESKRSRDDRFVRPVATEDEGAMLVESFMRSLRAASVHAAARFQRTPRQGARRRR
jgi:phospholipase C